jgi:hypothetical protein
MHIALSDAKLPNRGTRTVSVGFLVFVLRLVVLVVPTSSTGSAPKTPADADVGRVGGRRRWLGVSYCVSYQSSRDHEPFHEP